MTWLWAYRGGLCMSVLVLCGAFTAVAFISLCPVMCGHKSTPPPVAIVLMVQSSYIHTPKRTGGHDNWSVSQLGLREWGTGTPQASQPTSLLGELLGRSLSANEGIRHDPVSGLFLFFKLGRVANHLIPAGLFCHCQVPHWMWAWRSSGIEQMDQQIVGQLINRNPGLLFITNYIKNKAITIWTSWLFLFKTIV